MGLDMYLNARRYISSYFDPEDSQRREQIAACFPELAEHGSAEIKGITVEAGYWRKANHIHAWFVDKVQDGKDDCERYPVSREQLEQLKTLCQQIIDNPKLAEDLLPTRGGFFFGNTDYNQYYIDDLTDTVKIIDRALALPSQWDFEYQSSW